MAFKRPGEHVCSGGGSGGSVVGGSVVECRMLCGECLWGGECVVCGKCGECGECCVVKLCERMNV